jgi:hypothetical protein
LRCGDVAGQFLLSPEADSTRRDHGIVTSAEILKIGFNCKQLNFADYEIHVAHFFAMSRALEQKRALPHRRMISIGRS